MPRTPRIGELRHRVTIQRLESVPDGRGGRKDEWVPVDTVWACIEAVSAWERLQAQQVQTGITHRVVIRYRPDLTGQLRLVENGRFLYVQGLPVDPDGRRRWLEMRCEERGA